MKFSSKKLNILRLIPAGLYSGLIWHISSGPVPINITGFDKTVHIIEYSVLGALLSLGIILAINNYDKPVKYCLFFGTLIGSIDEIHQHFVPGRSMDIFDFWADITGIAAGILLWIGFLKLLKLTKKSGMNT